MTRNVEGEGTAETSASGLWSRDRYRSGGSPFKPPSQRPVLHRLMPVSEQLPGYRGSTFRRDLLAGLTVTALALPAAMAYAELAGLSPVAGLYALLLPTVAYTLFGSSRQLIVGPEGSIAALVATALVPLAADDPGRYGSLAGVVTVGVLEALLLAVALSIVDVVRRSATPHDAVLGWVERLGRYADVRLHPRARVTPGVLVYRLVFANASYVKGRVREALRGAPTPVRWLVFDAEALSHVDAAGVDALKTLVNSLREEDTTFVFARVKNPMREALREAGVLDLVGERHVYPTVRAAVAAALAGEEQP
jgi:MFS superfamily sulfate permease-like transporter